MSSKTMTIVSQVSSKLALSLQFVFSIDVIFEVLKISYMSIVKDNLPIFGIAKAKQLADYATSEKDVARGITRMPLVLARIYEEDIKIDPQAQKKRVYKTSPKASQSKDVKTEKTEEEMFMENLSVHIDHRKSAIRTSLNLEQAVSVAASLAKRQSKELDGDLNLEELETSVGERATSLYRRESMIEARWEDFELLAIIGRGTFGKVYLVSCKANGNYYAMKCIRKDVVIKHESVESLAVEKMILNQVNHPFIISMDYVFQKSYRIYFILDFIQGGELFKHLSEQKRFPESKAAFYAAQIAIALGYLHEAKIIYRDLKPENILLNSDGYIMLADFGLAKIVSDEGDEPNSFCGTPEYLSPEMIVGSGHDHTLDWWALGILIYEMIIGIPPFYNPNKHQMYYLIQHAPIRWPEKAKHGIEVSAEAKDLISKMLCKDRKERLGQNKDYLEILEHPFFKDLNENDLLEKKVKAPYIPKITDVRDIGNFDPEVTGQGLAESIVPKAERQLVKEKQDAFLGFGQTVDEGLDNSAKEGAEESKAK